MTETQVQIEKLRTLQESYDVLADGLPAISNKIDNIDLPEIDTTELAKEATLNGVSNKLDNLNVEVDLSEVAKESTLNSVSEKLDNFNVEVDLSSVAQQGENQEATNSAIYNDTHNVAQFFGITDSTEFTPLTTEEITNEINTLWEEL